MTTAVLCAVNGLAVRKPKAKKTVSRSISLDSRLWDAADILCDQFDVKISVVVGKVMRDGFRAIAQQYDIPGVLKALGDHKPSPFEPFAEPTHTTIPQEPYRYQDPHLDTLPSLEIPEGFMLPTAVGPPLERVDEPASS